MSPAVALTPSEAARWADRAGLPLPADRLAAVAATANHIQSVVSVLRELDFGDTPPAAAYRAEEEQHDAAV
ncbi:amidase [Streptomyces sp. RSD-27]|nr:amidase [Streptomyces sp. RSD-27]